MEHLTPSEKKARVLEQAGSLPPDLVAEHVVRLDSDYYNEFSVEEILAHLRRIAGLSKAAPFHFELAPLDERTFGLTVIGEDLPGFFAALSGLVASYDFDIRLGKVFTYGEFATSQTGDERADAKSSSPRKIVDYLVLQKNAPDASPDEVKSALLGDMHKLVDLLRAGRGQELRADLYRRIGDYLSRKGAEQVTARLPVEIRTDNDDRYTVVTVRGSDRKALLFSLSNALSLQGLLIHKILTRSEDQKFEDKFSVTDANGKPITEAHALDRLKVATVLMERFISTLPQASDYPAAVQTFNDFITSLMRNSSGQPELRTYEDFTTLSSLAKILGAGPFLWEEMTKLSLEEVTGLLRRLDFEKRARSRRELQVHLEDELDRENEYSHKIRALNHFKDYQLFRLDVVHLIFPHKTLDEFSGEISDLAEVVLEAALALAESRVAETHGFARSESLPCPRGLFAQGKLGGRELGYASDLEIQLIYGASGETDGAQPISNAEYYSLIVQEMRNVITARTEGIFELDLRLRPHGDSGPLSSNIEPWREYYGPGGGALDYERQALLKLRPIAGTEDFLARVMDIRDALLFGDAPVPIENTLSLREKQIDVKAGTGRSGAPGKINAKYSAGALVEVEYTVQFMQLRHGGKIPELREPNTEKALEVLLDKAILEPGEFEKLYKGYAFLRRLINALRMVRGHSRDLFVPARGSEEFLHLAKRMGYLPLSRFEPDDQLDWDLKHTLQDVHAIFARRFLGQAQANAAHDSDEISLTAALLDASLPEETALRAIARLGVQTSAVLGLLKEMLAGVREKGILCAALVVAEAKLRLSPDPEAVIRHLGQYLRAVPDPDYFIRQMLNHPQLQEILIKAFSHSEYLTNILLRQPDYLMALGDTAALEKPKLLSEFRQEILEMSPARFDLHAALDALRAYRNREYLRIGLRDIYLNEHLQRITGEISQLSNALIESAFGLTLLAADALAMRDAVSVIALGKLGGNELNYSSDIDIVFVFDPDKMAHGIQEDLERWARLFINALSAPGSSGKMFRVDTQLRPYGAQGALVSSLEHYRKYFREEAAGWELQAWLKARPVAGNLDMGRELVRDIQRLAVSPINRDKIEISMRAVRQMGLDKLKVENRLSTEVKLGPGGIRTIEFYIQYLQIQHGHQHPELISGNTLAVMGRLYRYRLLSHNFYELLSRSYVFLRKIEHVLQLQGLQQRHELPSSPDEIEKLARRMGFEERLGQSAAEQFRERYRQHMLTLQELSSTLFGYTTNLPPGSAPSDAQGNSEVT